MLLQPGENWKWWFDQEEDRLMLDLGDEMTFSTAYQSKELVNAAQESQNFSIEDARLYSSLLDTFPKKELSVPECVQIALNGVAVAKFYRPMMPQSWFFQQQTKHHENTLSQGQRILLQTAQRSAPFMLVETNDLASICMALESIQLSESRTLQQCEVIKVMNDRIYIEKAHQINWENVI